MPVRSCQQVISSRLAVSTNLLACLIAVCMRATGQIRGLTGGLEEHDRRLVAARAILGEWLALPLAELAGSAKIGDEAFNEVFHPIAVRLLGKCDAVLRVGGSSVGADEMVRVGRSLGLKIYHSPEEIPILE